ncbi:MAG: Uma2 family endonuclease [Gemmataceae bacterium]|nr:Uma2 family endonuclease [Gemmataceae bacterium]
MVATAGATLTIDEFMARHGGELGVDLVRGQVVRYPMPGAKHGQVCLNAAMMFGGFIKAGRAGRAMSNDTLIRITPDTARGADVCYLSYARLPKDRPLPDGPLELAPELVVEVRSPSDLWTDVIEKVLDYLRIGVAVVVVFDPKTESASVFRPGDRQDIFERGQTLTLPDVLPGFSVSVAEFFEE